MVPYKELKELYFPKPEIWEAEAEDRQQHWSMMTSANMAVVIEERPKADCAVNLDRRDEWPMIESVIQDAITLTTTDEVGVIYPTHDPSRKAPEERAWERFILSTVLDTGWVAPQLRDPAGRALLRTIMSVDTPPQTLCAVYDVVLDTIAPWLSQPLPVPNGYRQADTLAPANMVNAHHAIVEQTLPMCAAVQHLVYATGASDAPCQLQIGEQLWTIPASTLLAILTN